MRAAAFRALESSHVIHDAGPVLLAVHRDWVDSLPMDALLGGAPPTAWGELRDHGMRGRGPISVIATSAGEIVAKRHSRGGWLGGLLPDLFPRRGRLLQQAWLAEALISRGWATPRVIVARSTRVVPGLHALAIGTARVQGAVDLLDALRAAPDAMPLLALAGRTLRRLHDIGLRHRDLQVKNLLVPAEGAAVEQAVVLDLDGCTLGSALGPRERVRSVSRFGRSLLKRGVVPGFGGGSLLWTSWPGWMSLLGAYSGCEPGSEDAVRKAVLDHLSGSVRRHAWAWRGAARDASG